MRVLLIGGNGFIGSPLTEQLSAARHEVAIFHRSRNSSGELPGVRHIQGNRNQLSNYRDQFRDFAPDVIVDLVLSSGEQARELINVAQGITGRVVVLSTGDVYRAWGVLHGVESGELEPLPITEESQLRTTRKLYSAENLRMMQNVFSWVNESYDKIAVEQEIMTGDELLATVVRLPMVYGPGDPLHRFFPILKRIADGRSSIILSDDLAAWRGPRGYVENVAHAIALTITSDQAAGRVYNVCEQPCRSELEWQREIAMVTNWRGKFVVLPAARTPKHILFAGNAKQHVVISSERIRTELGYREFFRTDEAIQRTIAWEQTNPPRTVDSQQFDYVAEDAALAHVA